MRPLARPGISRSQSRGPFTREDPEIPQSRVSCLHASRCCRRSPSAARILKKHTWPRVPIAASPRLRAEMETLLSFYRTGRETESFDAGIQRAVRARAGDPNFLFRFEREAHTGGTGTRFESSILSSLPVSVFLWSSIPDEELRGWRCGGQFEESCRARSESGRLLADPRADAACQQFLRTLAVPP